MTYKRKARDLGGEKQWEPPPKKRKELQDFYKFQVRDKRRDELASLRKRSATPLAQHLPLPAMWAAPHPVPGLSSTSLVGLASEARQHERGRVADALELTVCVCACRFDNDKVRVAEMKKQRKFKPF